MPRNTPLRDPNAMLSVHEARNLLLERIAVMPSETCSLEHSLGRILAAPIASEISVPPFANSAMDGFAIRAQDTLVSSPTAHLQIAALIAAGSSESVNVVPGHAARIMTGAPIPRGADSVVPLEETMWSGGTVDVPSHYPKGSCIRPEGLDFRAGETTTLGGHEAHGVTDRTVCVCWFVHNSGDLRRPIIAVWQLAMNLSSLGRASNQDRFTTAMPTGCAPRLKSWVPRPKSWASFATRPRL